MNPTTNLIERLRTRATLDIELCHEAADTLEAQSKYVRDLEDAVTPELVELRATVEAQAKQIEELRADADSLDWLEIHGGEAMLKKYDVWTYQRHSLADIERFGSLRAAIDAARKGNV